MADNIGEIYVEISARMDKLEKQLNDSLEKAKRTGKGIEDAFKNKIISLDNALAQKSIQDLEKSAQRLKEHLEKKISLGAPAYQLEALQNSLNKAERAVVMFKKTAETVPQTINKGNQAVGNMNMTMGQLGFLIGDADMFFVNFRMGMMSVANNVPMVVQGLMQAKQAAESTGKSFSSVLASSLTGPGGVMIGINLLMFALNVLPQLFSDTTDKVKDQADEIDNLAGKYEKLTKQQLLNKQAEVQTNLAKMTAEMEGKYGESSGILKAVGDHIPSIFYGLIESMTQMSKDETDRYKTLLAENQAISDQLAKTGQIKDLDNQITELMEKRSALPKGQVHAYDEWIKSLKRQRQELDKGITDTSDKDLKELQKDKEQDLKTYYEKRKWFDADYNKFLDDELAKEIKDLSSTITDKNKLHEYEIQKRKEREEAYRQWLKDHKPELYDISVSGVIRDVNAGGFDAPGRKNKQGIYIPDTTMPMQEGLSDLKGQDDGNFRNLMKQFTESQQAAESFANSISNAFANAIVGGQNIGQIFSNLAVQLGAMVIQAVAFKAIMSALGFSSGPAGGSDSLMSAIGGAFGFNPTVQTGGSASAPMNAGFDKLNNSLQAMNVNMMSKGNAPVNVYMDGKIVATLTSKHQAQMAKGNVKV